MKILNKFGLYTKSDLKQAFENGKQEEQGKMYFINTNNFKLKIPKKNSKKGYK